MLVQRKHIWNLYNLNAYILAQNNKNIFASTAHKSAVRSSFDCVICNPQTTQNIEAQYGWTNVVVARLLLGQQTSIHIQLFIIIYWTHECMMYMYIACIT